MKNEIVQLLNYCSESGLWLRFISPLCSVQSYTLLEAVHPFWIERIKINLLSVLRRNNDSCDGDHLLSILPCGGGWGTARVHFHITPLEEVRNRNGEVSFKRWRVKPVTKHIAAAPHLQEYLLPSHQILNQTHR